MFARQQSSSDSCARRASVQLVSVQETVELARAIVGRGGERQDRSWKWLRTSRRNGRGVEGFDLNEASEVFLVEG